MVAFILGHVDGSDKISWIVRSPDTVHCCSQLGCLVLGLHLEQPGNFMPLSTTFTA